ncbi:MAG: sensor histidine kinase [Deltaproteobacteria bacterium]|nr:sensor histidine kinase [Deltaproteobacteria bacterium]
MPRSPKSLQDRFLVLLNGVLQSPVDFLFPERTTADEDERFLEYVRDINVAFSRWLLLCAIGAIVLFAPTDRLLYGDDPETLHRLHQFRLGALAACLLCYAISRWSGFRKHVTEIGMLLGVVAMACVGYFVGQLGDLNTPWYYGLYLVPFGTYPFFVGLPERLGLTVLFAVSALVAYFLPFPQYLLHPHVPVSLVNLAFACAVATLSGHAIYFLIRRDFFLQGRIRETNERLEAIVAEQTRDLRHLTAKLETAREEERSRIARDLHDELGQNLSAVRIEAALARRHADEDVDARRVRLEHIEALMAETMKVARRIVSELRPRVLSDFGLPAALEWLAKETRERTALDVRLSMQPPDPQIDPEKSIAVYRIVQESVNNVIRHAGATRVDLELRLRDNVFEARVCDDGVGLPPIDHRPPDSYGILGMRERAQMIGGRLEIASAPGGGTQVRVVVPIAIDAAKPDRTNGARS